MYPCLAWHFLVRSLDQTGLELVVLLPMPFKYWSCRHVLPFLAWFMFQSVYIVCNYNVLKDVIGEKKWSQNPHSVSLT